ncbi:hypothetical protein [Deinococcus sp.]|uniref:hypothetical protein n=1 Tax=Deinococcus sp. TaxID=47478 RepID=UPI003C7DC9C5
MNRTLIVALLALTASSALAHELARDGNVGALMHTDPDDAPLIGKPTAVFFELNQKGGKPIVLSQCACTLNVYPGGSTASRAPLSHGTLRQGQGQLLSSVVFPTAGAYTMVLAGQPKPGATFPAFKLSWVVRADVAGSGGGMSH